ncbi:MAG TPA: tetratricopeptide repeat protein, partial [Chroococcales cyanobacterium]
MLFPRFALPILLFSLFFGRPAFALEASEWNQQGLDLFRAGNDSGAIEAYHQAIAKQKDYPIALNNLGIAHYRHGDFPQAEENFKRAIALKGDYVQAVVNLGLVYFRTGRYFDALQQYWKAKNIDPFYVKMRVNKRKAEELLDEEQKQHPNDP